MTTEDMVMVRTRVDRSKRGSSKIPDQMDFRLEHLDYPGGDTTMKPTMRIQTIRVGPEPVEVTAGEAQTLKGLSRRIEIVKERVGAPAASTKTDTDPPEFNLAKANKTALIAELTRLEIAFDPKSTNAAMRDLIVKSYDEEDDEDE